MIYMLLHELRVHQAHPIHLGAQGICAQGVTRVLTIPPLGCHDIAAVPFCLPFQGGVLVPITQVYSGPLGLLFCHGTGGHPILESNFPYFLVGKSP